MVKRIVLLLACYVGLQAFTPQTIADITGDGNSHAVATGGQAVWIQFVAPSTNTGTARIGLCGSISTSAGVPLAAGSGFMAPPVTGHLYSLARYCYIVTSSDKLSIMYEDQY
jgi:hypothetical protein